MIRGLEDDAWRLSIRAEEPRPAEEFLFHRTRRRASSCVAERLAPVYAGWIFAMMNTSYDSFVGARRKRVEEPRRPWRPLPTADAAARASPGRLSTARVGLSLDALRERQSPMSTGFVARPARFSDASGQRRLRRLLAEVEF